MTDVLQDLQAHLDELNAEHQRVYEEREYLRAQERQQAQLQVALRDQIVATERKIGDEQALAALRDREDKQSALEAAQRIAVTMPAHHSDRVQRFADLADELRDELRVELEAARESGAGEGPSA